MKKYSLEAWTLMLLFYILQLSGYGVYSVSYDYSAATECLIEPRGAQYEGGIIMNPEFSCSVDGWTVFGQGAIETRESKNGNRYIVSHNRMRSLDSMSYKVELEKQTHYSFSAWVQVSEGSETVAVVFRTEDGKLIHGGKVAAENGCWSLLKGGVSTNASGLVVEILFECKNTAVEIWVDSVSLQPFTVEQWRAHQEETINKERKKRVRFQVTYDNKTAMQGAVVSIQQTKPNFPFGCGINYHILESPDYQNWVTSRFKYATFTNAMKWYSTEVKQGQEDYSVADAMLEFTKKHGILVRGHNIFWDNSRHQPEWVKTLSPSELKEAADRRINSVVSRYAGELIHWDVMNENLHFRFFEDKLGENASAEYFLRTHQLDPSVMLFLNEYNTIEYPDDELSSPVNYKKKLQEILSYPGNEQIPIGIGVQGHFGSGEPNLAYMRSSLDILGSTGYPIWLTEVSVQPGPNQAEYLDQILREAYAHPSVEGIIMFSGPIAAGFVNTSLADKDFKNTAAGDVVDKLINEWQSITEIEADSEGIFEASLFHGDYNISIKHPETNSCTSFSYALTKDYSSSTVHVQISA